MSQTKVYVGNLSYDTDENSLEDFFSSCGEITDLKLIKDRDTGRSKGFAFITFDSQEAMDKALQLNDQDLDGRKVRVNEAKESTGGGRRGGAGGGFGGNNRGGFGGNRGGNGGNAGGDRRW
jgi:heterogeneous nuclear ribonucleoprotein A1/A3